MVEGADGGDGVMEGWHVEPGIERGGLSRGWSNERCLWEGSCGGGGSKARRGQAGGMAVGPPCVLVPLVPPGRFCGQHLQPALHAKHTLQRGRLHMGLRGPEEKHSWGSAGRRGRWVSSAASLYQCLSQMKPWGDAVMRDERINSLQIILLWICLKHISIHSQCYCLFCFVGVFFVLFSFFWPEQLHLH